MKKIFFTLLLTLLLASPAWSGSGHDAHKAGHGTMAAGHGAHDSGMKIHESSQDGYTFEYRLIDMKEKMKNMKNMPEMKDTHHLMVFVKNSHGMAVKTAKVGYLIQEKGTKAMQKKMAMGMSNGFGADVTFSPGNHYLIKTKVMDGAKAVTDEFEYMGGDH